MLLAEHTHPPPPKTNTKTKKTPFKNRVGVGIPRAACNTNNFNSFLVHLRPGNINSYTPCTTLYRGCRKQLYLRILLDLFLLQNRSQSLILNLIQSHLQIAWCSRNCGRHCLVESPILYQINLAITWCCSSPRYHLCAFYLFIITVFQ